jgi:Flp pilus assembly CpaE family ATPase
MLIALASAKHAPGVTTTALGLASAWPSRMLLVEADPAGGDLAAWLQLPAGGGLVDALLELRRTTTNPAGVLWQQALPLDTDGRFRLLTGVDDPVQAAAVAGMWPLFADQLNGLSDDRHAPVDVIVDCGRLSETGSPWPLLHAADVFGIVVRPTVAGVRLTSRWLPRLRERLDDDTRYGRRLRLIVIGSGPYPAAEVAAALDTPLLAALPGDVQAAQQLAAGGGRSLHRRPLWRALVKLADQLTSQQETLRVRDSNGSGEAPANVEVSAVRAAAS